MPEHSIRFPQLSRRELLVQIGLVTAGLGLGACANEGPALAPGAEGPGATALGEGPFQTLHALADAVLPAPGRSNWDAASLRVAEQLADLFVKSGDVVLNNARAGLKMLEYLPLSTELSMSRFSRASRDERLKILRAWSKSKVEVKRIIAAALRRAVMFTAYAAPETWSDLGYGGTWMNPSRPPKTRCPLGMGAGSGLAASKEDVVAVLTWKDLGA